MFPSVKGVFAAFDELGCSVNWRNIPDRDSYHLDGISVGYAVISLSAKLGGAYGFTREVGLIATNYDTLFNKWFMTVKRQLERLDQLADKREVTGHVVFVASADPAEVTKIDDWTRGRPPLVIPVGSLPTDARGAAQVFTERLRLRMFSRNVYEQQSAVQGDDFYGRRVDLQRLEDAMLMRNAVILLGLRKSGKTSLLKEAGRRFRYDGGHFVYVDLEKLQAPPAPTVPELLDDLHEQICSTLEGRDDVALEHFGRELPASVSDFRRRLKRLLDDLDRSGEMLVVALDEIEHLCPPALLNDDRPELQEITQLLASLRSLVQETENFTFLLAGLSPAVVDAQMLFGLHNPIFQWASRHFVSPFSFEECGLLLSGLGRRMGLKWSNPAIAGAWKYSGGHAYLLRLLAAGVASQFDASSESRTVRTEHLDTAMAGWREQSKSLVNDTVMTLARYYPLERRMLETSVRSSKGEPVRCPERMMESQAVNRLAGLGLLTIDRSESTFCTPDFMNQIEWA